MTEENPPDPNTALTADTGFYEDLPAFTDFAEITNLSHYRPAPDDWQVVVADIRRSTDAVREGRYKDVNMVGACCITAALNVIEECEIPYVFGGDGATLLIPPGKEAVVREALVRTANLSEARFRLTLRIGFVPVADIRARGRDLLVARFEMSRGNPLAMFSGGGVELADQLVKEDDGSWGYSVQDFGLEGPPDLSGISCRWKPLKPRNGRMLCLMVRAMEEDPQARSDSYQRVIGALRDIMAQDRYAGSPVSEESLSLQWPPKGLAAEAAVTCGAKPYWHRYLSLMLESLIQTVCNFLNVRAGAYDGGAYREELKANSDFRRFDDMLRLVFDCSARQVGEIREMLMREHASGKLVFGMHEADEALMTCLVFSLEASEHVHFIDGADGGFWAASTEFKRQLADWGR